MDKNQSMPPNPTDAQAIERSLTEPEAFASIFDRHVGAIHGYLARRTSRDDADSLVGEVFRVAFEIRARYDPSRPDCVPWLYGIAGNVLRQHRRSGERQLRLVDRMAGIRPISAADPSEGPWDHDALDPVLRAVESLPAADRETVQLYAWEDLTYEQIAVALDVPLGTVRSRLNRARRRIREHVAIHGQEPGDQHARADRRCRS